MSWNVQNNLGGMRMWQTRYWDAQRNVMGMTWRGKFKQKERRICCIALPIKPPYGLYSSLGKKICFMENDIFLSILLYKSSYKTYTERSDYKVQGKKYMYYMIISNSFAKGVFFCLNNKHLPNILLASGGLTASEQPLESQIKTHQCYSRCWKCCPPDWTYSVLQQSTLFTLWSYCPEIVEIPWFALKCTPNTNFFIRKREFVNKFWIFCTPILAISWIHLSM